MNAGLTKNADELAKGFAGHATTLEELNGVMRALMKTALESMLNTELDVHLGLASLAGFPEAIQTAFPQARVQLCIVHLVRAALKYVTDADRREVVRDLRHIYQAATVLEAEQAMKTFGERWDAKYPTISKQ